MLSELLVELREHNKLVYIGCYLAFYILYVMYEIPAPQKPVWQFYFPLKLMLVMSSMVTSYALNYVYYRIKHRHTSFSNLIIFVGGGFFVLVMLPSFIVQFVLNMWNIDLWFLVAT